MGRVASSSSTDFEVAVLFACLCFFARGAWWLVCFVFPAADAGRSSGNSHPQPGKQERVRVRRPPGPSSLENCASTINNVCEKRKNETKTEQRHIEKGNQPHTTRPKKNVKRRIQRHAKRGRRTQPVLSHFCPVTGILMPESPLLDSILIPAGMVQSNMSRQSATESPIMFLCPAGWKQWQEKESTSANGRGIGAGERTGWAVGQGRESYLDEVRELPHVLVELRIIGAQRLASIHVKV